MYIFVYGSLKKEFENHKWIIGVKGKFIGKGFTNDSTFKMYSVNDYYPAISKGNEKISGELYDIDEDNIKYIDYLEGYPEYYKRDIFKVNVNNKIYSAYIYYIDNVKEVFRTKLPSSSKRIKRENGIASWEK